MRPCLANVPREETALKVFPSPYYFGDNHHDPALEVAAGVQILLINQFEDFVFKLMYLLVLRFG